jgi:FkbM family methyltransferase
MNINFFLKKIIIKYLKFFYIFYDLFIRHRIFINKQYYSQDGEDIFILNKFKKPGFYVDVGCHHPLRINNCHLLYKNKWRGLNVDLNKISIEIFNFVRRDDVNINMAVSLKKGKIKYYYNKLLGLSNSLLKKKYLPHFDIINSDRLDRIIDRTRFKNRRIDFLSIDVEGKDIEVLKSLDFKRYNPRSICVEIWNSKRGFKKHKVYKFLIKKKYSFVAKKKENYIFLKKI